MDALLQKINEGQYQLRELLSEELQVEVIWGERIISYQGDEAHLENLANLVAEMFEKEVQRFCPENEPNECNDLLSEDRGEIREVFERIRKLYQASNQIIYESYLSRLLDIVRTIFLQNFSVHKAFKRCERSKAMCTWVTRSCWDLIPHGYQPEAMKKIRGVDYLQIKEEDFDRMVALFKQATLPEVIEYNRAMDAIVQLKEEKGDLLREFQDLGVLHETTKKRLEKVEQELALLRGENAQKPTDKKL